MDTTYTTQRCLALTDARISPARRRFTKTGKPEIARLRVVLLQVVCFPLSGHDRFSQAVFCEMRRGSVWLPCPTLRFQRPEGVLRPPGGLLRARRDWFLGSLQASEARRRQCPSR